MHESHARHAPWCAALLALSAAALIGCSDSPSTPVAPGAPPPPAPLARGTVQGRVVDQAGVPLPGARVSGYPICSESLVESWRVEHTRVTEADESGAFTLADLLEGRVYLSTAAPGHCGTALTRLECRTGDVEVEIVLARCASVVGRVFGPDGRPLAGASVTMRAFAPAPGSKIARGGVDRGAVTGSSGFYSLPSLPLGEVELVATHPEHPEQSLFIELDEGDAITGLDFHL